MTDKISVHIVNEAQFIDVLHKIAQLGRKNIYRLLEVTAIYAFQSARKMMPNSKKKRPVRRATKEERKANNGSKLVMEWYDKDGSVRWIGLDERDDDRRTIKKRGAAKNSWSGLIGKVGKSSNVDRTFAAVVNKGTQMINNKEGDKPYIVAINKLRYQLKLAPNVESQAMQLAMNRVVGSELNKLGDEAATIWKG